MLISRRHEKTVIEQQALTRRRLRRDTKRLPMEKVNVFRIQRSANFRVPSLSLLQQRPQPEQCMAALMNRK